MLTPWIEVINDDTFAYATTKARDVQVGGFTWSLIFNWHLPPKEDLMNRSSIIDPIRSVDRL